MDKGCEGVSWVCKYREVNGGLGVQVLAEMRGSVVMPKVAKAPNIPSFNLCSHETCTCTHISISQRSQTKAKVKGHLYRGAYTWGGTKG